MFKLAYVNKDKINNSIAEEVISNETLIVTNNEKNSGEVYYYDEKGYLRSEQRDVRKLFHQLSRAKEELALVVKENTTVYAVLLNLLQGRK